MMRNILYAILAMALVWAAAFAAAGETNAWCDWSITWNDGTARFAIGNIVPGVGEFPFFGFIAPSWGMLVDEITCTIVIGGALYNFDDIGITVNVFVPYEQLAFTMPASFNGTTLLEEGMNITVFLSWLEAEFGITVPGHGTPPSGGGVSHNPAPLIRIEFALNDDGTLAATLKNVGDISTTFELKELLFSGVPNDGWIPDDLVESVILDKPVAFALGPHEKTTTLSPLLMPEDKVTYTLVMGGFGRASFYGLPVEQTHLAVGFKDVSGKVWWGYLDPALLVHLTFPWLK